MLTEICNYLKNWFCDEKYIGYIQIVDGFLYCKNERINIEEGQYFRIIGSVSSDAVYQYGVDTVADQRFNGAVWLMRVPADLIALDAQIAAWMAKYGGADSEAMSPYNSESFAGYSYSKSSGQDGSSGSWETAYGPQLARYRRI